MSQKADFNISRSMTRLYFMALTVIALLVIAGQFLMKDSFEDRLSDSRVISAAVRQRMLCQRICKTVLLLGDHEDKQEIPVYLAELDKALDSWRESHNGLQYGYLDSIQTPVHNSDTINAMFAELDPLFVSIFTNASIVSNYYHTNASPTPTAVDKNVEVILDNEGVYMQGMSQIILQYESEANLRVEASKTIGHITLFCTLGILIAEGVFVFRPAVNRVKNAIGILIDSEQQTQKMNEELLRINKSIVEAKEALLEATKQKYQQKIYEQKLRTASLIEGQEEERKRLALDIHDGLGQMLTALKFGIEKLNDSVHDPKKAQRRIAELHQAVSLTIKEARSISYNLMPSVLNDFGISSALKLLASQVSSETDINVLYSTNWSGKRLPKNIEIGLYRIGQEAIHNAVKYSMAKEIRVDLLNEKQCIQLSIADDGQGFAYDKAVEQPGEKGMAHGISNMKERVYMINGKIDIIARPGKGTEINVKVPSPVLAHA